MNWFTACCLALLGLLAPPRLAAEDWYVSYGRGLEAFRAGKWQEAVSFMNQAIDDRPGSGAHAKTYGMQFIDYFPYVYRGVAYFKMDDRGRARSDLEKAEGEHEVENASDDTDAQTLLREYLGLLRKGSPVAAQNPPGTAPAEKKTEVDKAAGTPRKTAPPSQPARKESGGQPPRESFRPSEAVSDTAGQALFRDAVALLNAGKLGGAKTKFLSLRQLDPSFPDVGKYLQTIRTVEEKTRKGMAAYFDGEYQQAIAQLSDASKNDIDNPHLYALLACSYAAAYLLTGAEDGTLHENAVAAFGKAREIDAHYALDSKLISPGVIALLAGR